MLSVLEDDGTPIGDAAVNTHGHNKAVDGSLPEDATASLYNTATDEQALQTALRK